MDSFFSTFISTFSYCDFLYYGGWKKILNTVASVLKFTGHPLPANPALSGITLQREVVFPPDYPHHTMASRVEIKIRSKPLTHLKNGIYILFVNSH